jgi:quinol monooxygenase YgiN
MFIATLTFNVWPDKRREFVSATEGMVDRLRSWPGCLACRLASDCHSESVFMITAEWDSRAMLDRYLDSPEFKVLQGTRILLRDGPTLSVDEVLSRHREPTPRRRALVS